MRLVVMMVATLTASVSAAGDTSAGDAQLPGVEPPAEGADAARETSSAPPGQPQGSGQVATLTTSTWEPGEAPAAFYWHLLDLPQHILNAALLPVWGAVALTEHYRLDLHLHDILTNDAGTAVFLPFVDVRQSDGNGVGIQYRHKSMIAPADHFLLHSSIRANSDHTFRTSYGTDVASLNGRRLTLSTRHSLDSNQPYFGLGGQTAKSDERSLRVERAEAAVDIEWLNLGTVTGTLGVKERRISYQSGATLDAPAVAIGDPDVTPPSSFGSVVHLPEVALSVTYDSRDTTGRTMRGILAQVDIDATRALEGRPQSSLRAQGEITVFLPVLPHYRVLLLRAGAAVVNPLSEGHTAPLSNLVQLGRDNHLRGYKRRRFRADRAWWASAEYRYPVMDYRDTGVGISAAWFADAAQAGSVDHLMHARPRFSGGFGLRGESAVGALFELQMAWSIEGSEIALRVGTDL